MFTLNDENLNAEAHELSDIEIMFEFIKLRELADICCPLKSLSVLQTCEFDALRSLLKALERKAS